MSNEIKTTYYDAMYFASSTINEKKQFFLRPVEEKILIKLIQYSKADENITWSSKNIHLHTCIPIGSIDKAIQRLKQKNYITVENKQLSATIVSRTITINWEMIASIDSMYQDWLKNPSTEEQPSIENTNNNVNSSITDTQIEETYPSITEEEKDVYMQKNEEQESIEFWLKKQNEKYKKHLVN
jgi:hypothetical protein